MWTLTSAVVRIYAAYHIHEKPYGESYLFLLHNVPC
jgi:hypothetical protein